MSRRTLAHAGCGLDVHEQTGSARWFPAGRQQRAEIVLVGHRREEATIAPTHSGPAFAAVFVADWQPAGHGGALRVIRLETYKSQDRVAMDAPRRQSVKL